LKTVANATFVRFQHNVEQIFRQLAGRGVIPEGDHAESAEFFIDLILGQAPMHVYTDWLAEAPTDRKLEAKIELFIPGRFGPKIAQSARTPSRPRRRAPRPAAGAAAAR
jgi:TetR/AcrR family transcriptional repressor of mexJK operon